MKPVVLGLDTSCYTTSSAIADEQGRIIAFARKLLPVEQGERGLRQSDALFVHTKQLPQIMDELFRDFDRNEYYIAAVCASATPRDEEGSYMPVFLSGLCAAQCLSDALGVPLYRTSHQRGHIEAGLISNRRPDGDFCALHLSGGTTELLACGEHIRIIGGSKDLHAGQLLDRVGVSMGYRFPAGAEVEKLAMNYEGTTQAVIPVSMEKGDLYCHLSGAENQAMKLLQNTSQEQVSAELFDFLARTIARMAAAAYREYGLRELLIVGGVSSSLLLREWILKRIQKTNIPMNILFGEKQYSADNAAGVARIGMRQWQKEAKA